MTFGVELARRVAPRSVTSRPLPSHGVGALATGARDFGRMLALSHVQRQSLIAESTGDLSVRPPVSWWPWDGDEPAIGTPAAAGFADHDGTTLLRWRRA